MALTITPFTGSSHLRGYHYNPDTSTLSVFFHRAPFLYTHTGVPAAVVEGWAKWNAAGYSAGKFYHSHIKPFPLAK